MRSRGFTVLEILIGLAIVAILVAVALPAYQHFMAKAKASEIIAIYDEAREYVATEMAGAALSCHQIEMLNRDHPFNNPHAMLSFRDEALDKGNPAAGTGLVLTVIAMKPNHGQEGLDIAREMHEVMRIHAPQALAEPAGVMDMGSLYAFALWISDMHMQGRCKQAGRT